MSLAPQDIQHYMRSGLLQLPALPPLSLYVHLPWCLKKCPYCDFNSHAVRSANGQLDADLQQRYIDALVADLTVSLPLVWGREVHSIFIGGGTPSLFTPQAIDQLLSQIRALLPLNSQCEITLEANPGTFETDRFKAFKSAGVTRLSIGVQSFHDAHLQALGRVHSGDQARRALDEAAACFDTFNLDLMYALPQQTVHELQQDLDVALSFNPPHLSIYHLTLEPNTYFATHPPVLPSDDDAYAMLDVITERTASVGLARYEVSAFARDAHRCWHNTNYWQFGDYLGIGAGAHSKLSFAHRIVRQTRLREPQQYMQAALQGAPLSQDLDVPRDELAIEYLMNALRLIDGFDLNDFTARTGLPMSRLSTGLAQASAKELITQDGVWVKPTPRGMDFLSDLLTMFLQ